MKNKATVNFFISLLCSLITIVAIGSMTIITADASTNAEITSASLSLEDNIGINFKAHYDGVNTEADTQQGEYGMIFWSSPQENENYTYEKAVNCNDAVIINNAECWKYDENINKYVATYTKRIVAKEMSDTVYAQAYANKDGVYSYSTVIEYSAATYAARKLGLVPGVEETNDENLKTLLRDMLNYGASAQKYFNCNTDNLASDILPQRQEEFAIAVVNGIMSDGKTIGIFANGTNVTLTADSKAGLSFECWKDETGAVVGTEPDLELSVTASGIYTACYDVLVYTLNDDGEGYSVSGLTKGATEPYVVSIPSTYRGKPVTGISDFAFLEKSKIQMVIIPDSVTSIGSGAFYYCTKLKDITIPHSVTSIGSYAFRGCTGLTDITIPCSVTSISHNAFQCCTGLTTIIFEGTESIWNAIQIDTYSDFGCSATVIFYTEAPVTFTLNPDAKSYSVSEIQDKATLPSRIFIPPTYNGMPVTSIGDDVFISQTDLENIIIPDSITSIGSLAFYNCRGLTDITIPDEVTSIGEYAFDNTGYYNNESNWINDSLYIGNRLIKVRETTTGEYIIKTGTKLIADEAFFLCKSLTNIIIPDSVTNIGEAAFIGCTGLTTITIPDGVTCIERAAFQNCTGLTTIAIPDSVTSIELNVFDGCTGLTDITIPDSVTSIKNSAFSGCNRLTTITIPDSVTDIGSEAFACCTGLTTITIPDSVTDMLN